MAIPRYLNADDAAESHQPIVDALRLRDAQAATQYMERNVGEIGEMIAAAMGAGTVVVPNRFGAGAGALKPA
jgi:DNA-binding GntR family transcriptional regulator